MHAQRDQLNEERISTLVKLLKEENILPEDFDVSEFEGASDFGNAKQARKNASKSRALSRGKIKEQTKRDYKNAQTTDKKLDIIWEVITGENPNQSN